MCFTEKVHAMEKENEIQTANEVKVGAAASVHRTNSIKNLSYCPLERETLSNWTQATFSFPIHSVS